MGGGFPIKAFGNDKLVLTEVGNGQCITSLPNIYIKSISYYHLLIQLYTGVPCVPLQILLAQITTLEHLCQERPLSLWHIHISHRFKSQIKARDLRLKKPGIFIHGSL